MILEIEKRIVFKIDTDRERARIDKSFSDDPDTKAKLLALMDAVERQRWDLAEAQIESEWWQGRDEEGEHPRLEFVGMIKADSPHMDHWMTYDQLIYAFRENPDVFKVINTGG